MMRIAFASVGCGVWPLTIRGAALHPGHRGTRYYAAPYHAARILAVSHSVHA